MSPELRGLLRFPGGHRVEIWAALGGIGFGYSLWDFAASVGAGTGLASRFRSNLN